MRTIVRDNDDDDDDVAVAYLQKIPIAPLTFSAISSLRLHNMRWRRE